MKKLLQLVVVKPFLAILVRLVALYIRLFHDYKIDSKSKCPACGCRKEHKMFYSRQYKAVIHQCAQCVAVWGQAPIVPPEKWQPQDFEEMEAAAQKTFAVEQ